MFVLVLWKEEKSRSIVAESQLYPNKEENEVTEVLVGNKKYWARILKKSSDYNWLKIITVTKEGEILRPGKRKNLELISEKKELKKSSQSKNAMQSMAKQQSDVDLLQARSVHGNYYQDEGRMEETDKQNEKSCEGDCSNLRAVLGTWIPLLKDMVQSFENYVVGIPVKPAKPQSDNFDIKLPDLRGQPGAVELRPNSNVFIDKMDLADAGRFTKNSREMIRRLMLSIVKKENLLKMTVKGNINHPGIPGSIKKAVSWYAKRHAKPVLEEVQFLAVLRNQINTLRHPKGEKAAKPIDVKSKSSKSDTKNDKEDFINSDDEDERSRKEKAKSHLKIDFTDVYGSDSSNDEDDKRYEENEFSQIINNNLQQDLKLLDENDSNNEEINSKLDRTDLHSPVLDELTKTINSMIDNEKNKSIGAEKNLRPESYFKTSIASKLDLGKLNALITHASQTEMKNNKNMNECDDTSNNKNLSSERRSCPRERITKETYNSHESGSKKVQSKASQREDKSSRDKRSRDTLSRERQGRDILSRETSSRDARNRESQSREKRSREESNRDAHNRVTQTREKRTRENSNRDASRRGSSRERHRSNRRSREISERGASSRERKRRDDRNRETGSRDASSRDRKRDDRNRETCSKNASSREKHKRDSRSREKRSTEKRSRNSSRERRNRGEQSKKRRLKED